MCFPGAGIGDVSDRLEACMAGGWTKIIVYLSVVGNDIGRVDSEELFRRIREALGKVRERGGFPVVCEVLPRQAVGGMWQSRAIALNFQLTEHCKADGWASIDNWDSFCDQDHHYLSDGVHPSQRGI